MEFFTNAGQWIKDRLSERTTWDGGVIIFVSVAAFVASPFVKYLAIAGAVYGAWTLWKKESAKDEIL